MTRRELLAGAAGALGVARLDAFKSHISRARISAITDEIGNTQADAIAFAKQYGLQWVELRNVPETKKEFTFLSEPELKKWSAELAANRLRVSFLDTSLLKFSWPGLVPAGQKPEQAARPAASSVGSRAAVVRDQPADGEKAARVARDQKRWDRRKEDVAAALKAANILGVDKVRVFTGARVEHPETAYPLIVRTLEELIPMAENARVKLLIENETSQNIGTSAEVNDIMALLPSRTIGYNWDPQNAVALGEKPWPDGYAKLPKSRMMNAQIKARGVLDYPDRLDWKSIMQAMERDNYQGEIGLETHIFDGTLIEKANAAMREILHITGEL